ncbi:hypothetical protein HP548_12450 [Paenibacillus taichungensis]|uniref:Uncharacterized protein n=1 Tax=Paenibacillus taichungensis TaxID=484184 RepID=A0ABX2MLI0_9BACL|nr:hypothetical protein [Paenibacillus taichungensis]NUU54887.1 hypothetical protein [Paenibacillus taichungensis]
MYTQELFGIRLFDYEEVQTWDEGTHYINTTFHLEELQKYNGFPIEVDQEWNIKIWSVDGKQVNVFCIIDIEEFKSTLLKRIN